MIHVLVPVDGHVRNLDGRSDLALIVTVRIDCLVRGHGEDESVCDIVRGVRRRARTIPPYPSPFLVLGLRTGHDEHEEILRIAGVITGIVLMMARLLVDKWCFRDDVIQFSIQAASGGNNNDSEEIDIDYLQLLIPLSEGHIMLMLRQSYPSIE